MAENSKVIYDTIVTMAELSDDEKVQQQCLREEKYERDMLNLRNCSLKEGQKIGEKIGEKRLASLIQKLIEVNRSEEIAHVTADEALRNALYREFDL